MPRESNNIRIPWSRHLNVPMNTSSEQSSQNFNENNHRQRQSVWESRRKSVSESDLRNGGNQNVGINDESGDSQSDPDSISLENWSPPTAGYNHNIRGNTGNWKNSKTSGKKQKRPIQGRLGRQCRLRGSKQNTALATDQDGKGNADFTVEINVSAVPDDEVVRNNETSRYTQIYLDCMYYSCLAPYKWCTKEQEEQTRCQYALSIIQKVSI